MSNKQEIQGAKLFYGGVELKGYEVPDMITIKRKEPIYWQHNESDCCGVVYSEEEAKALVEGDYSVDTHITKELYDLRIKQGYAHD